MAREEKPVKLRMVDEDTEPPVPVIRVDNLETEQIDRKKPVRLGPSEEGASSSTRHRLDLPSREEVEVRTHQPGIDVLMEPEVTAVESPETAWGATSSRSNPIPWGWYALIALLISSAVIWSWIRVHKAGIHAGQIETQTYSILKSEEQEQKEAEQLIDRINKTTRDYFSATEIKTLLQLIRQPERVGPLMHRYYSNKPVFSAALRTVNSLSPLTLGKNGNFWALSVTLSDGSNNNLLVEIDPSGTPKVDWETLVCYQPMPWDDYVKQQPAGVPMDFRVYVECDSFFSYDFASSERWSCFHLTAMNSQEPLFGYVPKGGDVEKEILTLLENNKVQRMGMILRLNVPKGIKSFRGVIIEKVISHGWLMMNAGDTGS